MDAATAEMIMCIHNSVPNIHSPEVCEYLLNVLEYNSLAFGINISESSSDSNDSGHGLNRRIINRPKRRIKNPHTREKEKRNSILLKQDKSKKKVHKVEENLEKEEHSNRDL